MTKQEAYAAARRSAIPTQRVLLSLLGNVLSASDMPDSAQVYLYVGTGAAEAGSIKLGDLREFIQGSFS